MQDGEHALDLGARRAELFGDRVEITAEVASLVHHIDEVFADHAPRRIRDRQRHLLGEVTGERGFRGDEGFEVVGAVVAALRARSPDHSE